MSNVRVRTKLLGGFAAVLALLVAVGALSIVKLGSVGHGVEAIANGSLPRLVTIRDVDAHTMDYRGVQYAVLAQPERRDALAGQLRDRAAQVEASFASFMRIAADEKDRRYGGQVKALWVKYLRATAPGTSKSLTASVATYDRLQSAIDTWAADSRADAKALEAEAQGTSAPRPA